MMTEGMLALRIRGNEMATKWWGGNDNGRMPSRRRERFDVHRR